MTLKVFLCFAIFVRLSYVGRVGAAMDSCSNSCKGTSKFGYRPGVAYEFDYNVRTSTSIKGASEGRSGLELTSKVYVQAVTKCDFILKVDHVELHETAPNSYGDQVLYTGSKDLGNSLQQYDLRFSFQDGIVDELCPSPEEPTWALNIKRGILSIFQNTMDDFKQDTRLKETDVTGTCDTEYTTADTDHNGHVLTKTKNLGGCLGRHGYRTSIQSVPYGNPDDVRGIPVLMSEYKCQQEISQDGLLTFASCVETHTFRPFSRDGNGAATETNQTLNFVQETGAVATPGILETRRGLAFEHHIGVIEMTKRDKDLEHVLLEICNNTNEDIRPDSAGLFSDLVTTLRGVGYQSMHNTYGRLQTGDLCDHNTRTRKFFLDALPLVATSDALHLMAEIIISDELTTTQVDIWLSSLSFIPNPTQEMLAEVTPLLSLNNGRARLAVSSLLYTYCQQHNCIENTEVTTILAALEGGIKDGCYVNEDNLQLTLMSLQALGNIGDARSSDPVLNSCISGPEVPTEVRLAAIQAYRRIPCDVNRSPLLTIFTNTTEDSELRIAAYLGAMQCADVRTIDLVNTALETEDVYQVGSFVWSHLKNFKETSIRHKQEIKGLLRSLKLRKQFDLDKRKYSRNYEKSIFLQQFNAGASFDANLIWSTSSFVPRSVSANLTVDLFGHSVNILEVGGRLEGLDYFLESFLGPSGYFTDSDVSVATHHLTKNPSLQKLRDIGRKYGTQRKDLKGAFYTRMFGNDIANSRFGGSNSIFGDNFNILEILISMSKNHDHTLTQNTMFMDSSKVTPTCAGLPLALTVTASMTVDVNMSGKMDFRKLLISPRSLVINGTIQPSAAIEVSSVMGIDAFVARSGVKMVSNLHTSTLLKGKVDFAEGRNLNLQIDLPREKMEIVNFTTAFYLINTQVKREQDMLQENKEHHRICTGERISEITGLQLCGEIQFRNASLKADAPYFPLTGPIHMAIELLKNDKMTGFKFETKFVKTRGAVTAKLAVDTPGSNVDRNIGVDFVMDMVDPSLTLNLFSPWKSAIINGSFINTRVLKRLYGKISLDTSTEYYMEAELHTGRKGHSYVYTPTLDIHLHGKEGIRFEGSILYLPFKSLDVDMTLSGAGTQPITVSLTLYRRSMISSLLGKLSWENGKSYEVSTGVHTMISKRAVKYRPYLSINTSTRKILGIDVSAEYIAGKSVTIGLDIRKIMKKTIKMFCRVRKTVNMRSKRYDTKVDVRSPYINSKVQSIIVVRGGKTLLVRSVVDYQMPQLVRDTITINGKGELALSKYLQGVTGSLNLQFKRNPRYNADMSVGMVHGLRKTKAGLDMQYGVDRTNIDKRIHVSVIAVHRLSWTQPALSLNSTFQHLAQGLNIGFEASYVHSQSSVESSVRFNSDRTEPFITTIRFRNKSQQRKECSGSVLLSYPGRRIKVENDFSEDQDGIYSNIMNVELEPTKKNTIVAVFGIPSSRESQCTVDINFTHMRRVRFTGRYVIGVANISSLAELRLAKEKYTFSTLVNSEHHELAETFKRHSSRNIATETALDRQYALKTDITWTVPKSHTRRFNLVGWVAFKSIANFEVSIQNRSPLGVYGTNISIHGDEQYVTHADVEWGRFHRITMDAIYHDGWNGGNRNMVFTLGVHTPFRGFRTVTLEASHISNGAQLSTSIDMTTKSMKPISASVIIKKPISMRNLSGKMTVKSPIKRYQVISLDVSHSFRHDVLTAVKLSWNNNMIQGNLEGSSKGTASSRDVGGHIGVKSTTAGYESMYISGRHTDDGIRFENTFSMLKNKKGIRCNGEMVHNMFGWQILNYGRVSCTVLSRKLQTAWNYTNTPSEIITNINSRLGRHAIRFSLNADYVFTIHRRRVILMTELAGNVLPYVGLSTTHIHDGGGLDHTLSLRKGKQIFSIENKFQSAVGMMESSHTVQVMNKIYHVKSASQYYRFPYRGVFEFKWPNKEQIHVSALLENFDGHLDGNLKIHTPKFKDFVLTLHQMGISDELISTITVAHKSNELATFETRYSWNNVKLLHLEVSTRYRTLRMMEFHLLFSGDLDNFHSESNVGIQYYPSKHFEINTMVRNNGGVESTFLLRIPKMDDIRFAYLQTEHPLNVHAELEYHPRKLIEGDIYFVYGDNAELTVSVKTPVTRDTDITIQYDKYSSRVSANVDITYGFTKLISANADFRWLNVITGNIALKSVYVNNINAAFRHEGKLRNFITHMELQLTGKKKLEADLEFVKDAMFTKRGSVAFVIPGLKRISAGFSHRGRLTRFNSNANMKYGNVRFEINAIFHLRPAIDATIDIATPFQGYKTLHTTIHHGGSLGAFNTKTSVGIGKSKFIGTARFALRPLGIEVNIQTPYTGYKHLRAFYTHKGSLSRFQGKIDVMYRNNKQIGGEIQFSLNPMIGTLTYNTPWAGYETLTMKFSHEVKVRKFQSFLDITLPRERNISISANVDLTDRSMLSAGLSIFTPFRKYNNIQAELTCTLSLSKFEGQLVTQIRKRRISVFARFDAVSSISGEIALTTPFAGYRRLSVAYQYVGASINFVVHTHVIVVDSVYELDFTYSALSDYEALIVVRLPDTEDVRLDVMFSKLRRRFSIESMLSYGSNEMAAAKIKCKISPIIKGSGTFTSQWSMPLKIIISQEGKYREFNMAGRIEYKDIRIVLDTGLDMTNGMSGKLNFRSPFSPKGDVLARIVQTRYQHFERMTDSEKMTEFSLTFNSASDKVFLLEIQTHKTDMLQYAKLNIKHTNVRSRTTADIQITANEQEVGDDIVLDTLTLITGLNVDQSLWYNDIIGEISYNVSQLALQTNALLMYSGKLQYEADVCVQHDAQSTLAVRIATPLHSIRNITGIIRHRGSLTHFLTNMDVIFNKQVIVGDFEFDSVNKIYARGSISSPFTKDISMCVIQNGTAKNMVFHTEIHYGLLNQVELNASWDLTYSIVGTVSLQTPLESLKTFMIKVNNIRSANEISSGITAVYNKNRRFEVLTQFSNGVHTDGSITFSSPFTSKVGTSFQTTEDSISGDWFYNDVEQFYVLVSVVDFPYGGDFAIRSVLQSIRNVNGTFRNAFHMDNFKMHGGICVNGHRASADVSFRDDVRRQGLLRVTSPFDIMKDVGISFAHSYVPGTLETEFQSNYGKQQFVGHFAMDRHYGTLNTSFGIGTNPSTSLHDIKGNISCIFTNQQFVSHAHLQWYPSHRLESHIEIFSINKLNISVFVKPQLTGYNYISIVLEHDLSEESVFSRIELSCQQDKTLEVNVIGSTGNDMNAQFSITTPYSGYEETYIILRNEIGLHSIQCNAEMFFHSHLFYSNVSLNLNGEKTQLNIPFTIKKLFSALLAGPTSGNMTLKTPYPRYEHLFLAFRNDSSSDRVAGYLEVFKRTGHTYSIFVDVTLAAGIVTIRTPLLGYEELSTTYTNSIERKRYANHFEFTYASNKTIALDLSCSSNEGSLVVTTPLVGYEQVSASVVNVRTHDLLTNQLEIIYQGKLIGYSVYLHSNSLEDFAGNITLNSLLLGLVDVHSSVQVISIRQTESFQSSVYVKTASQHSVRHRIVYQNTDDITEGSSFLSTAYNDQQLHVVNITLKHNGQSGDTFLADVCMSSPATTFRSLLVNGSHKVTSSKYIDTFAASINGQTLIDIDVQCDLMGDIKIALEIQQPRPLVFFVDVQTINIIMTRQFGVAQLHDVLHSAYTLTTELTVDGAAQFKFLQNSTEENNIQNAQGQYCCEVEFGHRTLQFVKHFQQGDGVISTNVSVVIDGEETFEWHRANIFRDGTNQMVWAVNLPSLRKELYSDIIINRDGILLDGRIGIRAMDDQEKSLTAFVLVEDLSSDMQQNYSIACGIQQPSTTIDLWTKIHLGKGGGTYTCGSALMYLMADNTRRHFAFNGQVNRAGNEIDLEIRSPSTSITVSGIVRSVVPYSLYIKTVCDEMLLETNLTIDPIEPTLDVQINYDIERVINIEAYYVNANEIKAEVFREVNEQRITEALITIRLNSSETIHIRMYWRPAMFQDLKSYGLAILSRSNQKLIQMYKAVTYAAVKEINAKCNITIRSLVEEVSTIVKLTVDHMTNIQQGIRSAKERIPGLYAGGNVNIHWAFPKVDTLLRQLLYYSTEVTTKVKTLSQWMEHSTNTQCVCIRKETEDTIIIVGSELLETMGNSMSRIFVWTTDHLETRYEGSSVLMYQIKDTIARLAQLIDSQYAEISTRWFDMTPLIHLITNIAELDDVTLEIVEDMENLNRAVQNVQRTRFTSFYPKNGDVQAEICLPIALTSLQDLPPINVTRLAARMESFVLYLRELQCMLYAMSDIKGLLPPYTGIAAITRNVFTTFDGNTYIFSGKCNYLLTGDLMDGNFSIMVHFTGKMRKTIIVLTSQHELQLYSRKKPRIDGAVVDMPYHSDGLSITKTGTITSVIGRGFSVHHNGTSDTYEFVLSGWYFGRTGGLLGTYDNEPGNDMMTPTGHTTDVKYTRFNTWKIKDCK